MGRLSVRLAPGVRVSVSSRGVRTHVGPRGARLHLGGGRTGISTGVGPVSYYTAVGGSRRVALRPTQITATTPAQQEKAALAAELTDVISSLQSRHTGVSFSPMTRPSADLPEPISSQSRSLHLRRARAGVPWYDIKGRRLASAVARERAAADDVAQRRRYETDLRNQQEELDAFWRRLTANEPVTVMAFLQQAFEDNDDPAAVVGVEGDEAYIAVVAPGEDVVPDRMPGITPTGRPSIRKMPARDSAMLHRQAVAGTILVTLMEAFAVAPGLASVRLAALERGMVTTFIWSVQVRRERLAHALSTDATSLDILERASDVSEVRLVGSARRLAPLDPAAIGWSELDHALMDAKDEEIP